MDKLYTINEVATRLNLSDKTLRRWEEAGRFTPSRTLGNQRRYSLDDIQILDALKHNVITDQKELLNASQAASLCGVTPSTIARWENEGKIHPFITSGYTFYPKSRLLAKLATLKTNISPSTNTPSTPAPDEPATPLSPSISPPKSTFSPSTHIPPFQPAFSLTSLLIPLLTSILTITLYHFLFNQPSVPVSPQVQGVNTTVFDPRVDDLLNKFQTHLTDEMLKNSQVKPTTTFKFDNTELISGTLTLPKGLSQISATHPSLSPDSIVTITFNADFSPAKKYWVTPSQGSFMLSTDFPVGQDTPFNYQFLTPVASPSAL